MEALPGFVSIPRWAGSSRSTGAFFSAVVEAQVGPDAWKVRLDGRNLVVTTPLMWTPGQNLRLKLVSQEGGSWLFRVLAAPQRAETPVAPTEATALMAAFLSRGLPLATERLAAWSRWLVQAPPVSDREGWAASLEARAQGPGGPWAEGLQPWLEWQAALERGDSGPAPQQAEYWDLWNSRRPSGGDPWLVVPLRWVYEGREDAGLLQAHWNPQAQAVDRWNLTAAPAGTPFRLEARSGSGRLDLTWHFFREEDRRLWEPRAVAWVAGLSDPTLALTLTVAGTPPASAPRSWRGVDVQA